MNLFATSSDPVQSAKYLDDKKVVKMCLETAQILATATVINGGEASYRPTHQRHPVVLWTSKTRGNYWWTFQHFLALLAEYEYRYQKTHKSAELLDELLVGLQLAPSGGLEPHPNCARNSAMGIDYSDHPDVYDAYKLYLSDRWETDKREPTWTGY